MEFQICDGSILESLPFRLVLGRGPEPSFSGYTTFKDHMGGRPTEVHGTVYVPGETSMGFSDLLAHLAPWPRLGFLTRSMDATKHFEPFATHR